MPAVAVRFAGPSSSWLSRCNPSKLLKQYPATRKMPPRTDMTDTQPKIRKSIISGRELFLCDGLVEPLMQQQIGTLVRTMHYVRTEKSRAGVPGLVAVCDIAPERIASDTFLRGLRQTVERLFPDEQFTVETAGGEHQ